MEFRIAACSRPDFTMTQSLQSLWVGTSHGTYICGLSYRRTRIMIGSVARIWGELSEIESTSLGAFTRRAGKKR